MTALTRDARGNRTPAWFWATAGFGVLWNLYGIDQFVGTLTPAGRSAMAAGMTAAQAQLDVTLPSWMTAVFAIGVFGGLLGSLTLALRRSAAVPVLAASLVGYVGVLVAQAAALVEAGESAAASAVLSRLSQSDVMGYQP